MRGKGGITATNLRTISAQIKETWGAARQHQIAAWEGYLRVGALLVSAREQLPGDREFGRWFAEQELDFTSQWGRRLMLVARDEAKVRPLLESALSTGDVPGVDRMLAMLHEPNALSVDERSELARCEEVIERGLQPFMEAAEALTEMRDQRLYRSTHPTFEALCRERWGWSAEEVTEMLEMAELVKEATR